MTYTLCTKRFFNQVDLVYQVVKFKLVVCLESYQKELDGIYARYVHDYTEFQAFPILTQKLGENKFSA